MNPSRPLGFWCGKSHVDLKIEMSTWCRDKKTFQTSVSHVPTHRGVFKISSLLLSEKNIAPRIEILHRERRISILHLNPTSFTAASIGSNIRDGHYKIERFAHNPDLFWVCTPWCRAWFWHSKCARHHGGSDIQSMAPRAAAGGFSQGLKAERKKKMFRLISSDLLKK